MFRASGDTGMATHVAAGRYSYARTAFRIARRLRPNEIMVFHVSLALLAHIISWLCGHGRVTVVAYGWDVSRNRHALSRLGTTISSRLIAISPQTALHLASFTFGRIKHWTRDDIAIIPPCVQVEDFQNERVLGASLRRRLGLGDADVVLLTVARLNASERRKGHEQVMRALVSLRRDDVRLRYLIVGDGDDRSRLELLSDVLGISESTIFAGFQPDVAACYSAADVFVMPSMQEGFGIVFLEAMSCGLPVVGGALDGSAYALQWGALGYLCDPGDARSVESAICSALAGRKAGDARADPVFLRSAVAKTFGVSALDSRFRLVFDNAGEPASSA